MENTPRPLPAERELLYFWAIGDMHFRAVPVWYEAHSKRLGTMFSDLRTIWQAEGAPAFCTSPGDIVDTCALDNYRLARENIESQLGAVPFYPGIGNHEYHGPDGEDRTRMAESFEQMWGKPLRYSWLTGGILSIMLDYPNPHLLPDPKYISLSQKTLTFLDQTLTSYADYPALIFLHCPLRNTVLGRKSDYSGDYHSLMSFFSPENSEEVRAILARHPNACLFFSGHTHTGWGTPGLVHTEQLGGRSVTFVNLMSPWYTGSHGATKLSVDRDRFIYTPDTPDITASFAVRVYKGYALIRVRDHQTQQWLREWIVPLR